MDADNIRPTCLQERSYYVLARMSSKFVLARIFLLCHYLRVATKRPLTIQEFARLGGKARAKKLTPEQRRESARKAIAARWEREKKQKSS